MPLSDEDKKCALYSLGTAVMVVAIMLIIFLWVLPTWGPDNMIDHMKNCGCDECEEFHMDHNLTKTGDKINKETISSGGPRKQGHNHHHNNDETSKETFCENKTKSTKQKITSGDYANNLLDQVDEAGTMKKNHKKWVDDLDGRYGGSAIVDDHNEALENSIPFVGFVGRPIAVPNRGIMPFENELDNTILPNHKSKGSSMYKRIGY